MYSYTFGGKYGKKNTLKESHEKIVVRTRNALTLTDAIKSGDGMQVLKDFLLDQEFPEADVTVLKAKEVGPADVSARDRARAVLKNEPDLRFAGRVLVDPVTKAPVLYTENVFIKFFDHISADNCQAILAGYNLTIKQKLEFATNSYFAGAPENTGLRIFEIAEALLNLPEVELCHPELIRKKSSRDIHPKQWHLKATTINGKHIDAHIHADKAHLLSQGENVVIAVIDDGFDIDHPEFSVPGKVIFARDVTGNDNDPRPSKGNNHGTACAGVAAAAGIKASGVAPKAKIIPIRCRSNLGSLAEANAFKWAADHGADIISCSWGPTDGDWFDPQDSYHFTPVELPDSTRLAIDYAMSAGRNGKGCIVTFAAGNGNEDVRFDGYASYHKVIAVAACNDTGKRSVYSDFGTNVWCCFPSSDMGHDPYNHPEPVTDGIYTTDRLKSAGYTGGDYTESFGGTSSACPGVAGTIALMLSVNPDLSIQQVKDIIRQTAVKIDPAGGQYDAEGHSVYYGFGRIDAEKAVIGSMALKGAEDPKKLRIISALVDPSGADTGKECITILNTGTAVINLSGWYVEVKGRKHLLTGVLNGGAALTVVFDGSTIKLANTGGTINLMDDKGVVACSVNYRRDQVRPGVVIQF